MKKIQFEKAFETMPESVHEKFEGAIAKMEGKKQPAKKRPLMAWAAGMAAVVLLFGGLAFKNALLQNEEMPYIVPDSKWLPFAAVETELQAEKTAGRGFGDICFELTIGRYTTSRGARIRWPEWPKSRHFFIVELIEVKVGGKVLEPEEGSRLVAGVLPAEDSIFGAKITASYPDERPLSPRFKIELTFRQIVPEKPPVMLGAEEQGFLKMGIVGEELEELLRLKDSIKKEEEAKPGYEVYRWMYAGHFVFDADGNFIPMVDEANVSTSVQYIAYTYNMEITAH